MITGQEAAKVLNCRPRTVLEYARQGRFGFYYFSKKNIQYRLEEILSYKASRYRQPSLFDQ